MNFILFLFLLGTAGPYAEATPFDTLEECETARALKAPQGKGV